MNIDFTPEEIMEQQPSLMDCIQELIDTGVIGKKDIVRLKKEIDKQRDEVKVIYELADTFDKLTVLDR